MKDSDLLVVENLRKNYLVGTPLEVQVLKGIDFRVKAGEFVAIIGQSGSGKSTLLNILGALDQPTSGLVSIQGVDISKLDSDGLAQLRNEKIGFVFQFHHLLAEFTCLENAVMPILISQGKVSKEETERTLKLLERVGVGHVAAKKANQISGGQQQRVAVIRALARRPALVLADEPTASLDPENAENAVELIRESCRQEGAALLLTSHDPTIRNGFERVEVLDA